MGRVKEDRSMVPRVMFSRCPESIKVIQCASDETVHISSRLRLSEHESMANWQSNPYAQPSRLPHMTVFPRVLEVIFRQDSGVAFGYRLHEDSIHETWILVG